MINVLFLHAGDGWIRGSEKALLTLLRGIDRNVISPSVYCRSEALASAVRALCIESTVSAFPEIMWDSGYRRLEFASWSQQVITLARHIRRRGVSLVYCNGGSTCQTGYYAAKLAGVPVICHVHSPYNRRYIILYRLCVVPKLIVVSNAIATSMQNKCELKGGYEVVHNGVDVDRFRPSDHNRKETRRRLSIGDSDLVFGQVSSLISRKGIDVLLRAFRLALERVPHFRLVLVGDGPDRKSFERLAGALSITDKVIFAGEQADSLSWYQSVLDVNVLASRSDAFPLSPLEAAACGLPTVAANADGIPEAVIDGETGLLFDVGDPTGLARQMVTIGEDGALRARLGESARVHATTEFTSGRYCHQIQRIILDMIQAKGSRKASYPQ